MYTLQNLLQTLLTNNPEQFGYSKVDALTWLFEQTDLKIQKDYSIVLSEETSQILTRDATHPLPPDLRRWTEQLEKIQYPSTPVDDSPKEIKYLVAQQIYLGTALAHYKPIYCQRFKPESFLHQIVMLQHIPEEWEKTLYATLRFWATHPKKPCVMALGIINKTSPNHIPTLITSAMVNSQRRDKIKRGDKISPLETLVALGWDTSAHHQNFEKAAKFALQIRETRKELKTFDQTQEKFRDLVYRQVLKQPEIAEIINLTPTQKEELQKNSQIVTEIQERLQDFNLNS